MEKNVIAPNVYQTSLTEAKAKAIQLLHKQVTACLVKGAKKAYEAGEILANIFLNSTKEDWNDWVKNSLKIHTSTIDRYMNVYYFFKDKPEEIESKTMKEALSIALADYLTKKPKETEERGVVTRGNPDKQFELDWETIFAKPPVSKAKLKNYRFECPDKRSLWLVKRGYNSPIKFMDLFTDAPENDLRRPYEAMMKSIQSSVELYFEQVERTEVGEQ